MVTQKFKNAVVKCLHILSTDIQLLLLAILLIKCVIIIIIVILVSAVEVVCKKLSVFVI